MAKFGKFLKKFFRRPDRKQSSSTPEELRAAFKARYHHFKLLLNANNKALEVMSDMEEALRGTRPFGMSFIKASCTAVSVNVFQMIRNLLALAPERYQDLAARFREIEEEINRILASGILARGNRLAIPLRDVDKDMAESSVGSKMAKHRRESQEPPACTYPGFVISSLGLQRFMEHNEPPAGNRPPAPVHRTPTTSTRSRSASAPKSSNW